MCKLVSWCIDFTFSCDITILPFFKIVFVLVWSSCIEK